MSGKQDTDLSCDKCGGEVVLVERKQVQPSRNMIGSGKLERTAAVYRSLLRCQKCGHEYEHVG